MSAYSGIHIPALIAILSFLNFTSGEKVGIAGESPSTIVFVGRTPCKEFAQDYGIAVPSDCFKLKWKITLTSHRNTDKSGTYLLQTTFNRQKDISGTWVVTKDPENEGRTIYQLNNIQNGKNLYLLSLDNQVVFFLRGSQQLYHGNEEFSYTLNRDSRELSNKN